MRLRWLRHKALLLFLCGLLASGCGLISAPEVTSTLAGAPAVTATVVPSPANSIDRGDVNLAHLNFLIEDVDIAGQPMAITHIYSEYPRYEWVDASGEGIACVDDAARAALVYLTDYESTRDPASLDKARRLLNFVLYMQAEDGQFYNFILDRTGTINQTGNTSFKSSGWWAARGARALAAGYRVMRSIDPTYASKLDQALQRIRDVWISEVATNYGKYDQVHGVQVPAWLIAGGSDVSSIVVLALLEYDRATDGQDLATRDLLAKLSEGLAAYQVGDDRNYPFGWHPDSATSPFSWHAWGSTQVFALARAGQQLNRPEWITSAKREADNFYARLLAGEMVGEWGVLPDEFPQIAYGTNSLVQALVALHQVTGNETYGKLAGLAAGWFYGNNAAGFPMYDPATGRGYDGLMGPSSFRVNQNAGAESTIEALMALQAVNSDPVASRYLLYQPADDDPWQVLEAENARQTKGDPVQSYRAAEGTGEARWSNGHYILVGAADSFTQEFTVPEAGSYYLYVAYLRQGMPREGLTVEAVQVNTPPAIDGDLNDWTSAQPLSVTSTANILRGAAGWGGPENDAFVGYVMWDDQNLYVAARVLSPTHHQTEIGPSVWKGDTLWIYLDTRRDRSSVDDKLTLAQTPEGPQVWNWKVNNYLPGADLAWKQGNGFYIYEAALPWKSLGVDQLQVGQEMGLELGRGCCGNGFQDISGTDPDTAANLVKMILTDQLSPNAANPVAPAAGPDAVALRWSLDGGSVRKQAQAGASDRDYLWLERLASLPLDLSAGPHTLTLDYAGTDPERSAALDGFLLMPAKLTKSFTGSGHSLVLTYDINLGQLSIQEH
jgi:Carbohydrate family 9 binding domain-like